MKPVLMLLALLAGPLAALEPRREGDRWQVGDERLGLAFHLDGSLAEIRRDGVAVATDPAGLAPFDLRPAERWLVADDRAEVTCTGLTSDGADAVVVRHRLVDWEVACRYQLDPAFGLLVRRAQVTWQGAPGAKLKGFRFRTPTLRTGPESWYSLPGLWPPLRRDVAQWTPGATRSNWRSVAPAIAQVHPQLSCAWLMDERTPGSDRGSVTVTEQAAGLSVTQQFEVRAHMPPGRPQEIGAAHLWLRPIDGETILRGLHDWMRQAGHVVPADRPAWFREAVLYSFHPGGTIGSGFTDLGGFVPATAFLDSIHDLGCNSIWIMPIEDAAVYHPRDYYQFQPGLGTPAQYRALVDRAHQLGLKVLQDIVPHGGSNTYSRAIEHPEWLAQEEDGSTLSYWCFDFNWPQWRTYMADVARHYVREYGVDGYRVDAVGGSKIANWNPAIPYARASHAQLQGGLNMLRSLRAAVKAEKPREGGLLAEVQGSVYGTESDAIYDFEACYTVFHGLRRMPPEQYVPQLRRWLHEQKQAEAADLLRLRHVESHDSLRSALWYGPDGQRALLALTAWIHGLPLVYHEMEEGSRAVFQRVFAIRRALPELNGGAADYLAVESPAPVFACLRTAGEQASVVAINFGAEPVKGSLAVPLDALPASVRPRQARELWGNLAVPVTIANGHLRLEATLPPLGFTVFALREQARVDAPPPAPPAAATPAPAGTLRGQGYQAQVDPQTGLLASFSVGNQMLLGPLDLFLAGAGEPQSVTMRQEAGATVAERSFGASRLTIHYEPAPEALRVRARWTDPPAQAALALPVVDAQQWSAASAQGELADRYRPRHLTGPSRHSSIYWRAQGTATLYDSLLQPLPPRGGELAARRGAAGLQVRLTGPLPARVRWLDRVGETTQLTALLAWRDAEASGGTDELVFELSPPRPAAPAREDGLRAVAGGWEYRNPHYRLVIGRHGLLQRLARPDGTVVVDSADLYSDHGYGDGRTRYAAGYEVEASQRIEQRGANIKLIFEGRLRGFYRFDLLSPRIDYRVEYELGPGPSFRLSTAARPQGNPHGETAFLALIQPLPDLAQVTLRRGGASLVEAATIARQRVAQSALLAPATVPDEVLLSAGDGPLLRLNDLRFGGPWPPNVFAHGNQFFVAFEDGPARPGGAGAWRWVSGLWTLGGQPPLELGEPPRLEASAGAELLRDGGFEESAGQQLRSPLTARLLPAVTGGSPWQAPAGGRVVSQPVAAGQAAAEVVGQLDSYRLWRQVLPLGSFPEGSRWRLTARLRGDAIRPGDVGWKVGALRFAVNTGTTTYVAAPPLTGTFDWRTESVELTIPAGLKSLEVQIGQNGSSGTLWADEVTLQRLPGEGG